MAEFKVGQRVHVEFDGVISYIHKSNDGLVEVERDGNGFNNSVKLEDITPTTDPANWPPQLGDIWEAEDHEFVIIASNFGQFMACIDEPDHDLTLNAEYALKALNPKLVRRRGQ